MCSNYDYLLFENFELTKQTFVEEQNIFQKVRSIRNILNFKVGTLDIKSTYVCTTLHDFKCKYEQSRSYDKFSIIRTFNKLKPNEKSIINSSPDTRNLESAHLWHRDVRNNSNYNFGFEKVYRSISGTKILIAALKGLIMLQDTYGEDIKYFSKGDLSLKSTGVSLPRTVDALRAEDLISMSGVSFNDLQWYDASIRYLKEAIDVFISTTRVPYRSILTENLIHECLYLMKALYPVHHNEMLNKRDNPIGMDYKLFPLMINEGSVLSGPQFDSMLDILYLL